MSSKPTFEPPGNRLTYLLQSLESARATAIKLDEEFNGVKNTAEAACLAAVKALNALIAAGYNLQVAKRNYKIIHQRVEDAYGVQKYKEAYKINDTELSVRQDAKFKAEDHEGTMKFQCCVAANNAVKEASTLCKAAEIRLTYARELVILALKCVYPSNPNIIAETATPFGIQRETNEETYPCNEYTAAMAYAREAEKDQTESIELYEIAMNVRLQCMSLILVY